MRRLISPFQMITDHCFPSLDSLSHTFTHTHTHRRAHKCYIHPHDKQVCARHLKRKIILIWGPFITRINQYSRSSAHRGEGTITGRQRQTVLPYLSWEWDTLTSTMTVCGNSVGRADNARPRPSVLRAWYWHSWSQWWMRHLPTSDTIFSHFQGKQYRCLKWMNTAEWWDTGNAIHMEGQKKVISNILESQGYKLIGLLSPLTVLWPKLCLAAMGQSILTCWIIVIMFFV